MKKILTNFSFLIFSLPIGRQKYSILLSMFVWLWGWAAFSQEPGKQLVWSLKQCIDYALEHNLQVKQSDLAAETSKQTLLQSEAQTLPNLNGFATNNYNFGQTIDPYTNQFANKQVRSNNFALSSSVTLFNGLQTYNTVRQNQLNLMASVSDAYKMKNDISFSIISAYLQVLFNDELLKSAKNQSNITRMQLERMQKLVEIGSIAKVKLLELEAQMASEELNVVNAENQLDLSYLSLKQLLDFDISTDLKIVKPDFQLPADVSITSTPGQVYDAALGIMPQIKSAEYRLISSEKTVKAAQGGRSPRLVLQGSLGTGYSGLKKDITNVTFTGVEPTGYYTETGQKVYKPTYDVESKVRSFNNQVNDNANKTIGFNLTIPIFNSLNVKTNIAKAKIAQQKADYDLTLAKNQLQKNVQQAYADAVAALKKYKATKKSVNALEESFKYADQRFSLGAINAVEFNDAKNKLIKSQSDLLQAKYDFVFKQKILDFYQGKSFVF